MAEFEDYSPTTEEYWRAIVLFGRNVASCRFALAKALLELSSKGREYVTLEDLAEPYSLYLVEHSKPTQSKRLPRTAGFLMPARGAEKGKLRLASPTRSGYDHRRLSHLYWRRDE